MVAMLKPGGLLAIMTSHLDDDARFARWHYRHDPTHVCFFKAETLAWLSQRWDLHPIYRAGNVWIARLES